MVGDFEEYSVWGGVEVGVRQGGFLIIGVIGFCRDLWESMKFLGIRKW